MEHAQSGTFLFFVLDKPLKAPNPLYLPSDCLIPYSLRQHGVSTQEIAPRFNYYTPRRRRGTQEGRGRRSARVKGKQVLTNIGECMLTNTSVCREASHGSLSSRWALCLWQHGKPYQGRRIDLRSRRPGSDDLTSTMVSGLVSGGPVSLVYGFICSLQKPRHIVVHDHDVPDSY